MNVQPIAAKQTKPIAKYLNKRGPSAFPWQSWRAPTKPAMKMIVTPIPNANSSFTRIVNTNFDMFSPCRLRTILHKVLRLSRFARQAEHPDARIGAIEPQIARADSNEAKRRRVQGT